MRNCSATAPCWRPSLRHRHPTYLHADRCCLTRVAFRGKGGRAEGVPRHTWRPPGLPLPREEAVPGTAAGGRKCNKTMNLQRGIGRCRSLTEENS